MELNDVVYLILMLAFIVFGIFNDSKKKKNRSESSTPPLNDDAKDIREVFQDLFEKREQVAPPPVPKEMETSRKQPKRDKRFKQNTDPMQAFESSLSLVTDFEGESSLKGYKFAENDLVSSQEVAKKAHETHPILKSLTEGDKQQEIQKALIYSEIINRKY